MLRRSRCSARSRWYDSQRRAGPALREPGGRVGRVAAAVARIQPGQPRGQARRVGRGPAQPIRDDEPDHVAARRWRAISTGLTPLA
jgi:hypothetical protein